MFKISRNTLDLWLKQERETGNCRAKSHYHRGSRHKITDWKRFKEFARVNGGKTQKQMAQLWGESVTQQNISDAIAKLGWSRKKKLMDIENEMKLNEQNFESD